MVIFSPLSLRLCKVVRVTSGMKRVLVQALGNSEYPGGVSFLPGHFSDFYAYKAWIAPFSAGWRQRDAYSREEDTGSQLHVLPHCYGGGVTAVTDAIQQGGGIADQRRESGSSDAFQTDKRAGCQQVAEALAIRQLQGGWRQFGQWVQHEGAQVHLIMRHLQAWFVDQALAVQQDIQVERAWAPTLKAFAALVVLDGLQRIEQFQRRQAAVQGRDRIGVARLAGEQGVALIEGRHPGDGSARQLRQRFDSAAQLLLRGRQIAAHADVDAFHVYSPAAPEASPALRLRLLPLRRRFFGPSLTPSPLLPSSRIISRRSLSLASW